MKKRALFVLLFSLLFFLAACTQQTIVVKQFVCADGEVVNNSFDCAAQNLQVVQNEKAKAIEENKDEAQKESADIIQNQAIQKEEAGDINKEYTFSLQQIRDLDKKLIGKRAAFLSDTMSEPIWINNTYTYRYAVQSDLVKPNQFKVDIKFLEARTKTNGKIGADELTEKWFINAEKMLFNLSKGEKKYIPLTLKVWDIANKESLPTFEGTYTFEAVIYSKELDELGVFNDVYTSNKFYVLVGKS